MSDDDTNEKSDELFIFLDWLFILDKIKFKIKTIKKFKMFKFCV